MLLCISQHSVLLVSWTTGTKLLNCLLSDGLCPLISRYLPFAEWRDIASRGVDVNGRTDGQPESIMLFTYYCWRRHRNSSLKTYSEQQLASFLINAQPLPAHRPAADDWQMIGRCPVPRAVPVPISLQFMPISALVWVRSFIEPAVLKTMYRSTIPLRFI